VKYLAKGKVLQWTKIQDESFAIMGPLQQVIDSYTDSRVTEAHHLQEICRYLASKPCKKHQKSAKTMFF
jgi:hypothetical protein